MIATAAAPAAAEPVGFRYEIMWGGFHAGDMAITRDEHGDAIQTDMTLHTAGMVDKLLQLHFAAEGGSRPEGGTGITSDTYQTRTRNRYKEQFLKLTFRPGHDPLVVVDEVVKSFAPPPEEDEPNPPVPPEVSRRALDPLTSLLVLGHKVRAALAGGPTRFQTTSFDGRRAYDFNVTVLGKAPITIGDRRFDTIAVKMIFTPLAGFKPRLLRLWDGAEYTVNLDPETWLPLRIATDSFAASTIINVVEPCHVAAEQCGPRLTGSFD